LRYEHLEHLDPKNGPATKPRNDCDAHSQANDAIHKEGSIKGEAQQGQGSLVHAQRHEPHTQKRANALVEWDADVAPLDTDFEILTKQYRWRLKISKMARFLWDEN